MYEYGETLDSINHAKQCSEKKNSISYANKSYTTHVSFHIFMDSSVHLKPSNTCIIESFSSQYSLTTTKNQNEAAYNYFDRRNNIVYQPFFQKKNLLREKN